MSSLARDSCAFAAGGDRLDPLLLPLLGCCVLLGEEVLLQAESVLTVMNERTNKQTNEGWMNGFEWNCWIDE